jgi:hypothetical protein
MTRKNLFVFFVCTLLISCEQDHVDLQGQSSMRTLKSAVNKKSIMERDLPPEWPEGEGGNGGSSTIVYTPSQSPTISTAAPFVLSGNTGGAFSSTGGFTSDIVAFGPAGSDSFPFVPPTGATKLWMGFILSSGPYRYVVRGYPFAISNGNPYWYGGALTNQLVAVAPGASTGTPNFTWIPSQYAPNSNNVIPGHYDYSSTGTVAVTTAEVVISQLSINAQGLLTLLGTVKIGGTTYQINKVNYKRAH